MEKITFDYAKLNKTDKSIYESMTKAEKERYEATWTQIESLKRKQLQQINASKERAIREKKALADRERKERTHRLIERGAILESLIDSPTDFTNEDIKEIIEKAMTTDFIKQYIENIRMKKTNEQSYGTHKESTYY